MRTTRAATLVLLGSIGLAVAYLATRIALARGATPPTIPWLTIPVLVAAAVALFAAGRPVRRWVLSARRGPFDALRAARTAVLAQAGSRTGAVLLGTYFSQILILAQRPSGTVPGERFAVTTLSILGAAAIVLAGIVVERWCRVPDDDDNDSQSGGSAAGTVER